MMPYRKMSSYASALKPHYVPVVERKVYRALVDGGFLLKRFHLSGNLLIKQTNDSAIHAVFQNEMGLTFFHFAWFPKNYWPPQQEGRLRRDDSFALISVIPQLDKPAVIRLLHKDFAMLLMRQCQELNNYSPPSVEYEAYPCGGRRITEMQIGPVKGHVYYQGKTCAFVDTIQEWGRRRPVTTISFAPLRSATALPDSAVIRHHTANLTIQLLPHNATEPANE